MDLIATRCLFAALGSIGLLAAGCTSHNCSRKNAACTAMDASAASAQASSTGGSAAPEGNANDAGKDEAMPESIGTASMKEDGTIVLQLRSSEDGKVAEGYFEYPPGHPQYDAILEHVGGLKPGEEKPVPPWDD